MNVDLIFKLLHIAEATLKFPEIRGLHDQAMFALKQAAAQPKAEDIHGVGFASDSRANTQASPGAFVRRAIPDTEKGDD